MLAQDVPNESASVLDVVMEGDDKVAQALKTIIKPVQNAPWATMKPVMS